MSVRPPVDRVGDHTAAVDFDPYFANSISQIIESWLPFVFAINSVSRAMGERDLYPFVIAPRKSWASFTTWFTDGCSGGAPRTRRRAFRRRGLVY
jgi:Putative zinc-binding metallo-peptidase